MTRTVVVDHVGAGVGTVRVYCGLDENNQPVTFGVGHRVSYDLDSAVQESGEVTCAVEEWQILHSRDGLCPHGYDPDVRCEECWREV